MTVKIFVKGAVMRHQVLKEVSQVSSRREMENSLRAEQKKLLNPNIMNKTEVRQDIKKWTKALDKTNPENLTVGAKNVMWKRAKEVKDEFVVGMLSKDELHPVKMFEVGGVMKTVVNEERMQTINSVKRQHAWNTKNAPKVREFKNLMRHLNPDNPNAADIERYRPRRSAK